MLVPFFLPIKYGPPCSWGQWVKENIDFYFYLKGTVGISIGGKERFLDTSVFVQGVCLNERGVQIPFLKTALKVTSYFTVVIPALMLIAKLVSRSIFFFLSLSCGFTDR
jgi:hypothetical protein